MLHDLPQVGTPPSVVELCRDEEEEDDDEDVCVFSVKGPELLNMYVGQSEENIREGLYLFGLEGKGLTLEDVMSLVLFVTQQDYSKSY